MNHHFDRRRFLARLLTAGLTASILPAWALQPGDRPNRRRKIMLDQLQLSDFSAHLGSTFQLHAETGSMVTLRLVEARALSKNGPRPKQLAQRDPFSILFVAPPDVPLTQRIYRLNHDTLGEIEIFLVPVGRDSHGLQCEAIFN